MMPVFATPKNNSSSTVGTPTGTTCVGTDVILTTGGGAKFPTTPTPFRVTICQVAYAYSPTATTANYTIYNAHMTSTPDHMHIDSVSTIEGDPQIDRQYIVGDVVELRVTAGTLNEIYTPFSASGGSHSPGIVPDPGSSAGTTHFLREDSTWAVPITGSNGTVTSVGLAVPSELSVSGSPVTTSGTLTVSKVNQNANLVYAGPSSGGSAAPTFRSLVAADIPGGGGGGGLAIGGSITSGTAGRVLYEGTGPVLADSSNLLYDGSTLTLKAQITQTPGNLVPAMTSDNAPSPYIASGSDTFTDYYYAFDRNTSTNWAIAPGYPAILRIYLGSAAVCNQYAVTGSANFTSRSPGTWTMDGSNDGSGWTTLDSQSGLTWGLTETKTFTISNSTAYLYYRMSVASNVSNANGPYLEVVEFAPQTSGGTLTKTVLTASSSGLVVDSTSATATASTVVGFAAQTGDLVQWQNSSGSTLSGVGPAGHVRSVIGAGAPGGNPPNGSMYYDTTNNKFYVYNGAWKSVTLA